jgi:hypothetical protein
MLDFNMDTPRLGMIFWAEWPMDNARTRSLMAIHLRWVDRRHELPIGHCRKGPRPEEVVNMHSKTKQKGGDD